MSNSFVWHIERALSSVTTSGQNGAGSNGNKGVFHIPQNFLTGALPSDCLALWDGGFTTLQRCSRCILQLQPTGQVVELETLRYTARIYKCAMVIMKRGRRETTKWTKLPEKYRNAWRKRILKVPGNIVNGNNQTNKNERKNYKKSNS